MTYIETPTKTSSNLGKPTLIKAARQLSTGTLLWLLVRRHKTALLATWAVTVTTVQLFPFAPSLVLSLFGK